MLESGNQAQDTFQKAGGEGSLGLWHLDSTNCPYSSSLPESMSSAR